MRVEICAASVLFAATAQVWAGTAPEVKVLVQRMQSFYEKTADFTANFKQQYTYKSFNRTQTSTGRVMFQRPGMMRWDYEKPSPKTFVLSGDKVYAYEPEAMSLTIAPFRSNQLSAAVSFLWGEGRLEKEFRIERVSCASCQGVLLEMTPLRPDPRFQKIRLEVDPKTAQVLKSVVIDPDENENQISFSDLKTNQKIDKELFNLRTPPNTQVTDFTKGPH